MTPEKLVDVLDRYHRKLTECGAVQKSLDKKASLGPLLVFFFKHDVLSHLLSMIPRTREFLKEGQTEKLMRWVGFIQGVLWVLGIYTIEELMDHNRPDAGNPAPKESA